MDKLVTTISIIIISLLCSHVFEQVDCLKFSLCEQNCGNLTDSRILARFTGTSFIQCVKKCWFRQQCKSLIFKRRNNLCELYKDVMPGSESLSFGLGAPCLVINRDDVIFRQLQVLFAIIYVKTFKLIGLLVIIVF